MLIIKTTNLFEKDAKKLAKRGKNLSKLQEVVQLIAQGAQLPQKYRDHKLVGSFSGFRECHIEPDWLLIYTRRTSRIGVDDISDSRAHVAISTLCALTLHHLSQFSNYFEYTRLQAMHYFLQELVVTPIFFDRHKLNIYMLQNFAIITR